MRIKLNKKDSTIIKQNETYTVIDNTELLNNLVVSKTILHPTKETTGHSHKGQEEVYHFVSGEGQIRIDETVWFVGPGDTVLIPDGAFHQVKNDSETEDLVFVCVFDGSRNH
tara:strand:+ start:63 stop:398 length:336 start_codon:yes stop_codon:yes gene_type:complete